MSISRCLHLGVTESVAAVLNELAIQRSSVLTIATRESLSLDSAQLSEAKLMRPRAASLTSLWTRAGSSEYSAGSPRFGAKE